MILGESWNRRPVPRLEPLDEDRPTVWIKYECERGCRWTAVKGGVAETLDGECGFSGCQPGHQFSAVGETTDSKEAHDWFRDIHRSKREDSL